MLTKTSLLFALLGVIAGGCANETLDDIPGLPENAFLPDSTGTPAWAPADCEPALRLHRADLPPSLRLGAPERWAPRAHARGDRLLIVAGVSTLDELDADVQTVVHVYRVRVDGLELESARAVDGTVLASRLDGDGIQHLAWTADGPRLVSHGDSGDPVLPLDLPLEHEDAEEAVAVRGGFAIAHATRDVLEVFLIDAGGEVRVVRPELPRPRGSMAIETAGSADSAHVYVSLPPRVSDPDPPFESSWVASIDTRDGSVRWLETDLFAPDAWHSGVHATPDGLVTLRIQGDPDLAELAELRMRWLTPSFERTAEARPVVPTRSLPFQVVGAPPEQLLVIWNPLLGGTWTSSSPLVGEVPSAGTLSNLRPVQTGVTTRLREGTAWRLPGGPIAVASILSHLEVAVFCGGVS